MMLKGTDDRFDGRYMSYSDYSVCTWFYLNEIRESTTLHLVVMTSTEGDISSGYRKAAPTLYIQGAKI